MFQILCVPFAMTNEHVGDFDATSGIWLGSIPSNLAAVWIDYVVAQVQMTRVNLPTMRSVTQYLQIICTKYRSTCELGVFPATINRKDRTFGLQSFVRIQIHNAILS